MNEHHPQQRQIEQLVRDTLGCGCPDEVFQDIESGPLAGEAGVQQLIIGGRLLLYLWRADSRDRLPIAEALLSRGRRERDTRGLNRFRLVLLMDAPDTAALLRQRWQAHPDRDEKTHIHLLPRDAADFLFDR